eukprot:5363283-Pyramimonas_sp.AAC.1
MLKIGDDKVQLLLGHGDRVFSLGAGRQSRARPLPAWASPSGSRRRAPPASAVPREESTAETETFG